MARDYSGIWQKGDWRLTGLWRLAQWPSFVLPLWVLALAAVVAALVGGPSDACGAFPPSRKTQGFATGRSAPCHRSVCRPSFVHGRLPPWAVTLSLRRWGTVALSPQGGVVPARCGGLLGLLGVQGHKQLHTVSRGLAAVQLLRHLRLPQHRHLHCCCLLCFPSRSCVARFHGIPALPPHHR